MESNMIALSVDEIDQVSGGMPDGDRGTIVGNASVPAGTTASGPMYFFGPVYRSGQYNFVAGPNGPSGGSSTTTFLPPAGSIGGEGGGGGGEPERLSRW